jgi:hypothetical protein
MFQKRPLQFLAPFQLDQRIPGQVAFKHGHGYRSDYNGTDASAAEEFLKLTDFASELETSYGCLYRDVASAGIGIVAATKVPFTTAYLTSTGATLVGSRDIDASVANSRLTVRNGGLYRARFQSFCAYGATVAAPLTFQFYVDGVAAGFPFTNLAPVPGTVESVFIECLLLVNDKSYVEVFAVSAGTATTAVFQAGTNLLLIGNRL